MILWKKEDFLVAQEQKLGTRGHGALLEHSLVLNLVQRKENTLCCH